MDEVKQRAYRVCMYWLLSRGCWRANDVGNFNISKVDIHRTYRRWHGDGHTAVGRPVSSQRRPVKRDRRWLVRASPLSSRQINRVRRLRAAQHRHGGGDQLGGGNFFILGVATRRKWNKLDDLTPTRRLRWKREARGGGGDFKRPTPGCDAAAAAGGQLRSTPAVDEESATTSRGKSRSVTVCRRSRTRRRRVVAAAAAAGSRSSLDLTTDDGGAGVRYAAEKLRKAIARANVADRICGTAHVPDATALQPPLLLELMMTLMMLALLLAAAADCTTLWEFYQLARGMSGKGQHLAARDEAILYDVMQQDRGTGRPIENTQTREYRMRNLMHSYYSASRSMSTYSILSLLINVKVNNRKQNKSIYRWMFHFRLHEFGEK